MTYIISKQFHFSAAHRIEGHPTCGRLHGHNYVVEVTLVGEHLSDGMILDYGLLSKVVKPILDDIDHRYILSIENIQRDDPIKTNINRDWFFSMDVEQSTAECLAEWFFKTISSSLKYHGEDIDAEVKEVTVHETPRTRATYHR